MAVLLQLENFSVVNSFCMVRSTDNGAWDAPCDFDVGRFPTQFAGIKPVPRRRAHPLCLYSLPGANGQPYALYSLGGDGNTREGVDADIGVLPPPQ